MAPIRFFCKRCNLMMKIGASMFGRGVVCPQCGEKLTVPFESDPKAEALYQFMKQKRAQEKAAAPSVVAPSVVAPSTNAPSPVPPPQISRMPSEPAPAHNPFVLEPAAPTLHVDASLEDLEPDEVESWIDQFWATVPETDEHGNRRGDAPHTPQYNEEPVALPVSLETPEITSALERFDQTRTLFRTLLGIVFVTGFVLGIFAHSRYVSYRYGRQFAANSPHAQVQPNESTALGTLSYPGPDGRPRPDADAVIILLPLKSVPPILIGSEGLRPNDEAFDPNGENAILIEEFGGMFRRTGADGAFSIPYKNEGRYLAVMISSHVEREDEKPDATAIRRLKNYFLDPASLIGPYAFALEEYEFTKGQYQINHTF